MDKIIVIYIISSLSNKGPTNILYSIINQLDRSRFIPIIFPSLQFKCNTLATRPKRPSRPILVSATRQESRNLYDPLSD